MIKTKVSKSFNVLLSILIILVSYGFIYFRLFHKKEFDNLWGILREAFQNRPFFLVTLILLMLLNWSFEAWKWKYLLKKHENISLFKSLMAVFSGVTISIFTPNRIGEYIGRIFVLKKTHPVNGALITILGSISQLVITIFFGLISALIFIFSFTNYLDSYPLFIKVAIFIIVLTSVGVLLILYFNLDLIYNATSRLKFKWVVRFLRFLKIIISFSQRELFYILSISAIRYVVFSLQFYLLIYWLGLPIRVFDAFVLISLIFFVMAAVPTIALSELGVRGSVSVFLWEIYSNHIAIVDSEESGLIILSASAFLWLINLMIPAIIGSFFMFSLNFFDRKLPKP